MTRWLWNWEISLTILLFKCVTLGGKTACSFVFQYCLLVTFKQLYFTACVCAGAHTKTTLHFSPDIPLTPHVQRGMYVRHLCCSPNGSALRCTALRRHRRGTWSSRKVIALRLWRRWGRIGWGDVWQAEKEYFQPVLCNLTQVRRALVELIQGVSKR